MGLIKTFLAGRTVAAPAAADEFTRLDAVSGNTEASTWTQMKDDVLTDVAAQYAPIASPTFTGAVVVPAAAAANSPVRVTAIDASLGRLALGGYEVGDTGRRNVASLVNATPWPTVGSAILRRVGYIVSLALILDHATSGNDAFFTSPLPSGFRPGTNLSYLIASTSANAICTIYAPSSGAIRPNSNPGSIRAALTWTTNDAWPSSLPGSAA